MLSLAVAANLIVVGMRFDLSKTDWSGWVQAIGSIAALLGAFILGKQQSATALGAIHEADRLSAQRRANALAAIATAAAEQADRILNVFHEQGFHYIQFRLADFDPPLDDVKAALHAVPMHEVGSYPAVTAMINLKTSTQYAQKAIQKVSDDCGTTGSISHWQAYDTAMLRLCADNMLRHSEELKQALAEG